MHHHVFRRCSHSSANISSFCSTDCSSSVNPPVFLSSSANGNCLTNPTSLFTSLQPPHTLFTWKVWNPHQCFFKIQYIDLPTLRSPQCRIKGAQGSNVFSVEPVQEHFNRSVYVVLKCDLSIPAWWTRDQHWHILTCELAPLFATWLQFLELYPEGTLVDCHPEFRHVL